MEEQQCACQTRRLICPKCMVGDFNVEVNVVEDTLSIICKGCRNTNVKVFTDVQALMNAPIDYEVKQGLC